MQVANDYEKEVFNGDVGHRSGTIEMPSQRN